MDKSTYFHRVSEQTATRFWINNVTREEAEESSKRDLKEKQNLLSGMVCATQVYPESYAEPLKGLKS